MSDGQRYYVNADGDPFRATLQYFSKPKDMTALMLGKNE